MLMVSAMTWMETSVPSAFTVPIDHDDATVFAAPRGNHRGRTAFRWCGRKTGDGGNMRIPAALVSVLVSGALTLTPVVGQQLALAPEADCATEEPDSVQISWDSPCEQGDWLFEPGVGCRMWDWHPDSKDKASWTGACNGLLKEGRGVVQWTEHGKPIDHFEGNYRNGRREGPGLYVWNGTNRFEGTYADDVPHGPGTVTLAGTTLAGDWHKGCLTVGSRVVAIGVSRASCENGQMAGETATLE